MLLEVIPANRAHVPVVAMNMRAVDVLECDRAGSIDPVMALRAGLDSDEAWTALWNGKPIAMFGANLVSPQHGACVWMLGTDDLNQSALKRHILRTSAQFIDRWLDTYGRLFNDVDASNTKAIRLLRGLGFQFGNPFNKNGHPFIPFSMEY